MKDGRSLADLRPGDSATVTGFDEASPVMTRLLQLGLIDGTDVTLLRRAPAGDPLEIRFAGGNLSLRLTEARAVFVSPADA